MLALTTDGPVCLISTNGTRQVWPVSRGCLLLLGTWSYLRICRRSVLSYTQLCNCLLNYGYVLHINFAMLYWNDDGLSNRKINHYYITSKYLISSMYWTRECTFDFWFFRRAERPSYLLVYLFFDLCHTVGAIGQQRMLTHPLHLILPSFCQESMLS
jgi:hypothetical protein